MLRYQNIPNLISLLRMLLVLPLAAMLLQQRYLEALLIFGLAGITDALDGFLAKRNGWKTRLGSILDPLADKLLLTTSYLVLAWLDLLPLWLVAAIVARDFIIVLGAIAYHYTIRHFDLLPSRISKFNTVMQIVLVLAVMLHHSVLPGIGVGVEALIYIVLGTTFASGVHYVWTWGTRALQTNTESTRV